MVFGLLVWQFLAIPVTKWSSLSLFQLFFKERYSGKNPNRGGWGYKFLKKTPGSLRFSTLLQEISDKMKFHRWKFHKVELLHPRRQKPRYMEVPNYFFLLTPGNSTSFFIDPSNFHTLFFQYLRKFYVLNPSCLEFFWNSSFGIYNSYLAILISNIKAAVVECPKYCPQK